MGDKIGPESIENLSRNRCKNLSDFGSLLGPILVDFEGQNELKFGGNAIENGSSNRKVSKREFAAICNENEGSFMFGRFEFDEKFIPK